MSTPQHDAQVEQDAVEGIVHLVPIVLPIAGAVLMFLLAFIAVNMA
jgi:predicted membrane channel-forming protein YqfA (hemolysin III family)